MYQDHFGISEPAFSIAVNPRYLFMSRQHQEALAHLLYGVQNGGFVMLTGEVGTGKTTLIRRMLEQLPENADLAFILNPMANAIELLCTICEEFSVPYDASTLSVKTLTDKLQQFLLKNYADGRKSILLIDEAQLLRVPVLEQIRLLTNLETTTHKLLQIILVGQPELKTMLSRPALRQLSQRITARFHLDALNLEETAAYIAHRLSVAGMKEDFKPFPASIVKKVHQFSGGIPRLINVLCDRLLLGAYAANTYVVSDAIFKEALKEVAGNAEIQSVTSPKTKPFTQKKLALATMLGGLVLIGGYGLFASTFNGHSRAEQEKTIALELSTFSSSASQASLSSSSASTRLFSVVDHLPADTAQLLGQLLALQTTDVPSESINCVGQQARLLGDWVCERQVLTSWNELQELNRPVILTLHDDEKRWRYALVDGLGRDRVRVQSQEGSHELSWAEVIERWNGQVLYVWRKPSIINGPLQSGDKGAAVVWVAETFAALDGQSTPLTRHYYTEKLQRRVEIFQLTHGLFADGVFGAQTLRKLNEVLGYEKTLVDLDKPASLPLLGEK